MRVKGGIIRNQRRKRILKDAQGYYGAKSKLYKKAKEQLYKSQAYAFNDRRKLKGEYRRLWILRINAAVRNHDLSYSKFIYGLKLANIIMNRKMLSELAIENPDKFNELIEISKKHLASIENNKTKTNTKNIDKETAPLKDE